jgi:hypothetical protein
MLKEKGKVAVGPNKAPLKVYKAADCSHQKKTYSYVVHTCIYIFETPLFFH